MNLIMYTTIPKLSNLQQLFCSRLNKKPTLIYVLIKFNLFLLFVARIELRVKKAGHRSREPSFGEV